MSVLGSYPKKEQCCFMSNDSSETVFVDNLKSVVIMVDIKKRKLRRKLTERVGFSVCPGFSAKRMNCIHEAALVKYIKADDVSLVEGGKPKNGDNEHGNGREGFWYTAYYIGKEDITIEKDTISYASTKSRNFFVVNQKKRPCLVC